MPTHLSAATIHELGTKLGEDFGFADDQSFRVLSAKQNLQAQRATSIQMLKYFRGDEGVDEPRSAVLENFAARFLPSLISAYRSQPDNSTLACYNFAIASLVGSPYFHKYIRRTANGYRLLAWTTDVAVQEQLSTPHKNSYSPNPSISAFERFLLEFLGGVRCHKVSPSSRITPWRSRGAIAHMVTWDGQQIGGHVAFAFETKTPEIGFEGTSVDLPICTRVCGLPQSAQSSDHLPMGSSMGGMRCICRTLPLRSKAVHCLLPTADDQAAKEAMQRMSGYNVLLQSSQTEMFFD
ncbi:hypothetical protein B0H13DRAFT_1897146 [Mycena leptocephala]|nr:hypothetical protein B0H13DRAFT_1897146 [Mycena leptocephala]